MAKNLILWLVIAVVLMMVFQNISGGDTQRTAMPYSVFLQQVDRGDIRKATIDDSKNEIRGERRNGETFVTYIPYLDMKLINFGISFNDSLPLIVTRDCVHCIQAKLNSQSINKFDEFKNLKCPIAEGDNYCPFYYKEGISGSFIKTKIELGNKNFKLKSTLFIKDVYKNHPLSRNKIEAVLGFRQPDFDGNYDNSFLRQVQVENDIVSLIWSIRF